MKLNQRFIALKKKQIKEISYYIVYDDGCNTTELKDKNSVLIPFDDVDVSLDGDMYCALWGNNLQEGIAGFGRTEDETLIELQKIINETYD